MPKDDQGRELQKHTLNLFHGDFARLADLFPASDPSRIIRHMVRDLIKRTDGEGLDVEAIKVPELD
jgi:hypothetical protein